MIRLHYMPGSCALAAHIALEWAGAPYEAAKHERAEMGGEAYRRINPKGQVPALELDDGRTITEAFAVLLWIADSFPAARIAPSDGHERTRLHEVLAELTSDVHPAFAPFFAPDRYVGDPALQDGVRAKALERIKEKLARIDQLLREDDWLLERRSVADAYLYAMIPAALEAVMNQGEGSSVVDVVPQAVSVRRV
jgi:glutathione S-transferase